MDSQLKLELKPPPGDVSWIHRRSEMMETLKNELPRNHWIHTEREITKMEAERDADSEPITDVIVSYCHHQEAYLLGFKDVSSPDMEWCLFRPKRLSRVYMNCVKTTGLLHLFALWYLILHSYNCHFTFALYPFPIVTEHNLL